MKRVLLVATLALLSACPDPNMTTDVCKGRAMGDLIITEVMIDPEGTDTGGEWIEVFNTLGTPLDMKGLTLYVRDTDGSGSKTHVIRAGSAPARGYFTMGDIRSGPNPSWINYAYADALGSMGNSRGVVGVRCGMTVLAEFTYNSTAKPQRSRMLNGLEEPNATLAAVEANYCDTPTTNVYFGNNSGTPGLQNPQCQPEAMTGTCIDNGVVRAITGPAAGDLVINEVMSSPSATSDTTGEWIELFARANVDLNDLVISTTTDSTRITSPTCVRVQTGQYVLLARSADPFVNGTLPTPNFVYTGLSLADTNQQLAISKGDAGIDSVSLLAAVSGHATQLDPTKQDPASNDDPMAFCSAPARWVPDAGGDFGSPGVANPSCGNVIDCSGRAAGDFVITEVMADPDGTDTGNEWIELFNTKGTAADLTGLTLYRRNVDGTGEVTHAIGSGTVPANGYFVLGDVRSGTNPAWVNYAYGTGLGALSNSSGTVGIRCGALVLGEFTYTTTPKSARSRMLDAVQLPPTAAFAVEANYCFTPPGTLYFGNNAGTPGAENPVCVPEATTGTCIDTDGGMRSITAPNAGDLIITELMADPTVTEPDGEWVEVLARAPVDLNDLTLYRNTTTGRITNNACLRVDPGQYLILGRSNNAFLNGNLPRVDIVYPSVSFNNTGNQIIGLRRGDDAGIDEIQLSIPSTTSGRSWQLDSNLLDPMANDNPANFCPSQTPWNPDGGGDFGTPGSLNGACQAPGTCFDTGLNAQRPIVHPPDGNLVITEWMSDPGPIADTDGEYFEFLAKSVFDLNGISFRIGATGTPRLFSTSMNCVSTTANTYYVVGRNPNMTANGGLPAFAATLPATALTLTSTITLLNPDGGTADSVTTAGGGNGISEQVNPSFLTPADNDTNHCQTPAGTTYGTANNRGTPGLANAACP
ncbi:MAG: lamin tail domain-containing protein [Archangium sp.]